jgi:hypothetical protein
MDFNLPSEIPSPDVSPRALSDNHLAYREHQPN